MINLLREIFKNTIEQSELGDSVFFVKDSRNFLGYLDLRKFTKEDLINKSNSWKVYYAIKSKQLNDASRDRKNIAVLDGTKDPSLLTITLKRLKNQSVETRVILAVEEKTIIDQSVLDLLIQESIEITADPVNLIKQNYLDTDNIIFINDTILPDNDFIKRYVRKISSGNAHTVSTTENNFMVLLNDDNVLFEKYYLNTDRNQENSFITAGMQKRYLQTRIKSNYRESFKKSIKNLNYDLFSKIILVARSNKFLETPLEKKVIKVENLPKKEELSLIHFKNNSYGNNKKQVFKSVMTSTGTKTIFGEDQVDSFQKEVIEIPTNVISYALNVKGRISTNKYSQLEMSSQNSIVRKENQEKQKNVEEQKVLDKKLQEEKFIKDRVLQFDSVVVSKLTNENIIKKIISERTKSRSRSIANNVAEKITVNKYFDNVYVIIKDELVETKLIKQLNQYQIKYQKYISNRKNFPTISDQEIKKIDNQDVIKLAIENKYKKILIIQDEIKLTEDFEKLRDVLTDISSNTWDFLLFSDINLPRDTKFSSVPSNYYPYTHIYGVSNRVFGRLVNDWNIAKIKKIQNRNSYLINKKYATIK